LARYPRKMPPRKCHCDNFAAIFAPRSLTASPIALRVIFKEDVAILGTKTRFYMFFINRSFIRPPSLEPRPKINANRSSSYQLLVKHLTFLRQKLKFPPAFDIFVRTNVSDFMKTRFLILSTFKTPLKGFVFLGNAVNFFDICYYF